MRDRPTHGWCPACKEESAIDAAGNCLWCDGPTEQREAPKREQESNGAALGLSHAHLRALHRAHVEQGATVEALAGRVAERVADKSPESAASLIRMGWNRLDLSVQETPRSEDTMDTVPTGDQLEEACEEIAGALAQRPGEALRAREIQAAVGFDGGRFRDAMKRLRESGRIRMEGQRAGARYRLADDDAPAPETSEPAVQAESNGKPDEERPSPSQQEPRSGEGQVEPPPLRFRRRGSPRGDRQARRSGRGAPAGRVRAGADRATA